MDNENKYLITLQSKDASIKKKIKYHARLNGMSISSFVCSLLSVILDEQNKELLIAILKKAQEQIISQYSEQ